MPRPTSRDDAHRGRDLSIVVWATTVGACSGRTSSGSARRLADALHLPALTGALRLLARRPRCSRSPLAHACGCGPTRCCSPARRARGPPHPTTPWSAPTARSSAAAGHRRHPGGPAGAGGGGPRARGDGQRHGDDPAAHAPRRLGAAAHRPGHQHPHPRHVRPLAGRRAWRSTGSGAPRRRGRLGGPARRDRCSPPRHPPGWSPGLAVGLFLLGVGWSCTLVSGSTLISGAVPVAERAGAQGASDLVDGARRRWGRCAGRGGRRPGWAYVLALGPRSPPSSPSLIGLDRRLPTAVLTDSRSPRWDPVVSRPTHTPPDASDRADSRVR